MCVVWVLWDLRVCLYVNPYVSLYVYMSCVYVCVCVYLFLSLTMKYLTLSILFQFIEGEGIPTGGDRIGYTYTLTPIIKLSYFLFNRYKTTTALPWLFISTFVLSLVHSITSRARVFSRLTRLTLPRLSFRHIYSVYLPSFPTRPPSNALYKPFVHNVVPPSQHRRRRVRASYSSSSPSALLTTYPRESRTSVPTDDRKLRAPRTLEQHTRDYRGDLLIQDLAHHQGEQAGFVLQKESPVVRMPGEVEQRAGRTSQHVEAGAHRFGIVAQSRETVLISDAERGRLGLLDERDEQRDARRLQGDGARDAAVRGRQEVQ